MDQLLESGGVEPENRRRASQIVASMKRVLNCRQVAIVNVAEGHDYLLKFYQPVAAPISARASLSMFANECSGVREVTVYFPRSGIDAPLEVHVCVAKADRRGLVRYSSPGPEKIYLDKRMQEKAGDLHMPRALAVALRGVAAEVITYCKPELQLQLAYSTGDHKCVVTFNGVRECELSFLEHLFERCGRWLVDVDFRSRGLERQLVVHLDTETKLADFPVRKEEKRTTYDSSKRARMDR